MNSRYSIVLLPVFGTTLAIGLSRPVAADTTRVVIQLVRTDRPGETVDTACQGSDEPHYRGPITSWPFGVTVDGTHSFDKDHPEWRIEDRKTSLALDLSDGEHVLEPGGHEFRVAGGKIESQSPELMVRENRVSLRLHPVTFTTTEDQGAAAPVWVRLAWKGRELWRNRIIPSMSLAGWHLQTDLNQLPVPREMAQRYRHHVAIVDRPFFGQPEGTKKEKPGSA